MNDEEHPAQASLSQGSEDDFPILEVLAAEPGRAAHHAFLALAGETDGEINASWPETVAISNLDVLSIEKENQEIGIERTAIAKFELLDKGFCDAVKILFWDREPHPVERLFG